jgi:hypothetical protein
MEGGEAKRAKTETGYGHSRLDPAIVICADESEAKVNGVACLHAHERAPYKYRGAVQEASDDVAEK